MRVDSTWPNMVCWHVPRIRFSWIPYKIASTSIGPVRVEDPPYCAQPIQLPYIQPLATLADTYTGALSVVIESASFGRCVREWCVWCVLTRSVGREAACHTTPSNPELPQVIAPSPTGHRLYCSGWIGKYFQTRLDVLLCEVTKATDHDGSRYRAMMRVVTQLYPGSEEQFLYKRT